MECRALRRICRGFPPRRIFDANEAVVEEDAAEFALFGGEAGGFVAFGHGGDEVVGADQRFEEILDRQRVDGKVVGGADFPAEFFALGVRVGEVLLDEGELGQCARGVGIGRLVERAKSWVVALERGEEVGIGGVI